MEEPGNLLLHEVIFEEFKSFDMDNSRRKYHEYTQALAIYFEKKC